MSSSLPRSMTAVSGTNGNTLPARRRSSRSSLGSSSWSSATTSTGETMASQRRLSLLTVGGGTIEDSRRRRAGQGEAARNGIGFDRLRHRPRRRSLRSGDGRRSSGLDVALRQWKKARSSRSSPIFRRTGDQAGGTLRREETTSTAGAVETFPGRGSAGAGPDLCPAISGGDRGRSGLRCYSNPAGSGGGRSATADRSPQAGLGRAGRCSGASPVATADPQSPSIDMAVKYVRKRQAASV